ncbi:MAG: hypothetical protein JO055_02240 [Alphaproteobacteria bacterium]|nr:hypothetical protein [Alphaproteobacteria bacterium]
MIATDLPLRLREAVDQQLARDEVLVRLEQPDPVRFKRIMGWIGFVLGLPLMVYALSTIVDGAMGQQRWTDGSQITPALAVFYGLPCLGIALAFMGAPLWNDRAARSTIYAITDHRVLILRRRFLRAADVQSIPAATLQVNVKPRSGNIELVASTAIDDEDREDMFRLIALRDVQATEAALNRLIQSSSKSSL